MAVAMDQEQQALWLRNARVWTGGEHPRVFDGGVLVRDGRQEALGDDEQLAGQAAGARVIDAGGRLLVPGFINAHMHLYSALARGLARMAIRIARAEGIGVIGLTGGAAVNDSIASAVREEVGKAGLRYVQHEKVPPGDGGLSFGQLVQAGMGS